MFFSKLIFTKPKFMNLLISHMVDGREREGESNTKKISHPYFLAGMWEFSHSQNTLLKPEVYDSSSMFVYLNHEVGSSDLRLPID